MSSGVHNCVASGHELARDPDLGCRGAEVQLGVGRERRGEQLPVVQILAETEPVERVDHLFAVLELTDDGFGVAGCYRLVVGEVHVS